MSLVVANIGPKIAQLFSRFFSRATITGAPLAAAGLPRVSTLVGQAGARTARGFPVKTVAITTAATAGSIALTAVGPEIAKETTKTAQIFKPLFEGIGDIGKTISSSPLLTGGSLALVGLVLLGGLLLLKK